MAEVQQSIGDEKVGSTSSKGGSVMNYYHLPEKHHAKHELCFMLHDSIGHMLAEYEAGGAFLTEFPLATEDDKKLLLRDDNALSDDHWKWLELNGHTDTVVFKTVVPALVSDFLHFVYTALECAAKGKMSVAYSLFRKPFYDHLFFFEWLISDQTGFLKTFYRSPHDIDKVHVDGEKTEQRKDFIRKCLSEIERVFPEAIAPIVVDVDLIYDIRYNKDCQWGFQEEWNTATHLITTHKKWTTEPMNFNFVFIGDDERESLWEHLYSKLPLLLMYAMEVVMVVFNRVHPLNPAAVEDLHEMCIDGIRTLSMELGFDFDQCVKNEVAKALAEEKGG